VPFLRSPRGVVAAGLILLATTAACNNPSRHKPGDESVSVPLDQPTSPPSSPPPSPPISPPTARVAPNPAAPPAPQANGGATAPVAKPAAPAAPLTPRLEIPAEARALSRAFANVAKAMAPSVVRIDVEVAHPDRNDGDEPTADTLPPELRRFFRFGEPGEPSPQHGTGSGVVLDGAGNIVTNRHVVSKASKVSVTFSDGSEISAHVVGLDQQTDVAVVRLDKIPRGLTAARIGDSEKLDVGEWVLAVGSPLGLDQTVTAGIISGKGRVGRYVQMSGERVRRYIQTDAKINPGNSGGPLVNLGAEVVGINTLINTGPGGAYGFAIPINQVRRVADALIKDGRVRYPFLGVLLGDLKELNLEQQAVLNRAGNAPGTGAYVSGLSPSSPASVSGLRVGDVIVGLDSQSIEGSGDVVDYIAAQSIGAKVQIHYVRQGKKAAVGVVLAELPGSETVEAAAEDSGLGLALQTVTPSLAESLGLKRVLRGAAIVDVVPGSPAEKAGLSAGEIVIEVDRKSTPSAEDALAALRTSRKGGHLLRIRGPAGARFVTLDKAR
jgi:serine protease Do